MLRIKLHHRPITLPTKQGMRPNRAWQRLIGFFLILTAIILAGGYLAYRELNSLEAISQRRLQDPTTESLHFNEPAILAVIKSLEKRALRTEELKISTSTMMTNPSL